MEHHFKLTDYKAIEELELKNLGNVNILCGKNSSGKSSILEALYSDKNSDQAVSLNENSLNTLIASIDPKIKNYSYAHERLLRDFFSKKISLLFKNGEPFYSKETEHIGAQLRDLFSKEHSINSENLFSSVLKSANEKINPKLSKILIPAKRRLTTTAPIDLSKEVSPDGGEVINKLFYLKCQEPTTSEYTLYKIIFDKFKEITSHHFSVTPNNLNALQLSFRSNGSWIEAEKCGLGLREVLVLITILMTTDYDLYLIEEPENHLHPDFQKKFLYFLKSQSDKKFLLATHSSVFVDSETVDKIFYCWYDDKVNVSDETSMSQIVNALGYSVYENITSDALILTEGPTDIPVIKKLLSWTNKGQNFNIKFWPLGGDIMASLDLSLFHNRPGVFAIIDSDPGSTKQRNIFIKNCKEAKITCYKLDRYSVENYFTISAIKSVFPELYNISINELSPKDKVDDQLFPNNKNSNNPKTIKGKNDKIIDHMSIKDVANTDLWDYITKIVKKLNE